MSASLSNVFITEFQAQFEAFYQGTAILNGTTMEKDNIVGKTWSIPKLGPVVLAPRGASSSPISSADPEQLFESGVLQDFARNIPVDRLDELKTNVSVRAGYAEMLAMAAGRREDQFKIDAWIASGTSNVILNGGTGLTLAKLRQASAFLNKEEVGRMDRHIVVTETQLDNLLADPEVTSSDFNVIKALVNGDLQTYLGFNFHIMGSSRSTLEGGLPIVGSIRTCFAWHKRSTWMGFGKRPSVKSIDDEPNDTVLLQTTMSADAFTTLDEGVVKIDCFET